MTQRKQISILGSTGSIGRQTLDIIRAFPNLFKVTTLSAHSNLDLLKAQIQEFQPTHVHITHTKNKDILHEWSKEKGIHLQLYSEANGLNEISQQKADLLVMAIVGTSGIQATASALEYQIPIALACKEVLVSAGDLIMQLAQKHKTQIIPMDSEHAAIQQCLTPNQNPNTIHSILLTASGGPFWELPYEKFADITPETALKHPNWSMGQKISIDSATMVNKGLEIIEAHHLFKIPYSQINAVIHRQSLVHALVEFNDGNLLAHLCPTDMRFPIQYALTYPKTLPTPLKRLMLTDLQTLTFEEPDKKRFPLLQLAINAGKAKGSHPVVFNAANEALVSMFLKKQISFLDIQAKLTQTMDAYPHHSVNSIDDIINLDQKIKHDLLSPTK